jgi:hypothetical protein
MCWQLARAAVCGGLHAHTSAAISGSLNAQGQHIFMSRAGVFGKQ